MQQVFEAARNAALTVFAAEGAAHRNCAQSVMTFMLEALHLDKAEAGLARYLGGGVALSGLFCGALNGAALALAIRDRARHGDDWDNDVAAAGREELRAILAAFTARFGSTSCRELTGCDLSTTEGFQRFRDGGAHDACVAYVAFACERLAEGL